MFTHAQSATYWHAHTRMNIHTCPHTHTCPLHAQPAQRGRSVHLWEGDVAHDSQQKVQLHLIKTQEIRSRREQSSHCLLTLTGCPFESFRTGALGVKVWHNVMSLSLSLHLYCTLRSITSKVALAGGPLSIQKRWRETTESWHSQMYQFLKRKRQSLKKTRSVL